MKELKKHLKEKQFKRVYLFYGKEAYLKKSYEKAFQKAVLDGGDEMMNYSLFDDRKLNAASVIDAADTLPFLSDKRLVIARDTGFFQAGRKEEAERMAAYLPQIPESTCLIFVEEDIDKRGKLYKAVAKEGYVCEFKLPDERTLVDWIMKEMKLNKIEIKPSEAAYLYRTAGGDMESLSKETEKLVSYKNGTGSIAREDIDAVCTKSLETRIFDLVAAIGGKRAEEALRIYRNLLLMKESPIMILSMVTRQFRLIFESMVLLKMGENNASIASRLGQRDFVIRECLKQSKNFSEDGLKGAIEDCLDCDISIKTGRMAADMAVELLILTYSKRREDK